jgi:Fe-S-cluster containining protein
MTLETIEALAGLARQRQLELDEWIAAWRQGAGAGVHLWCGPGCGNCCSLAVNTTLPEALAIAGRLAAGQQAHLAAAVERIIRHARKSGDTRSFLAGYRRVTGPCPFLDAQGYCTIYPHRPLACRALLATRPSAWCGVNLAELAEIDRTTFLASLDRSVVAFPTHYAVAPQQAAADFERGLLFAMLRFTGFGLSGNLPLLVWLSQEPGFATALAGGLDSLRAFLAARDVDRPFLVQFDIP